MIRIIAKQARHAKGILGHIVARVMAFTTAKENRYMLQQLHARAGDNVLELGCGHGHVLRHVAQKCYPGKAVGVDPSSVMLEIAARGTKSETTNVNLELLHGDSEHIPVADRSFDRVFSVHTIYFWPSLSRGCQSLKRILRPGGTLLLVHHSADRRRSLERFPDDVYQFHSDGELENALRKAGFCNVSIAIGSEEIRYVSATAT